MHANLTARQRPEIIMKTFKLNGLKVVLQMT